MVVVVAIIVPHSSIPKNGLKPRLALSQKDPELGPMGLNPEVPSVLASHSHGFQESSCLMGSGASGFRALVGLDFIVPLLKPYIQGLRGLRTRVKASTLARRVGSLAWEVLCHGRSVLVEFRL